VSFTICFEGVCLPSVKKLCASFLFFSILSGLKGAHPIGFKGVCNLYVWSVYLEVICGSYIHKYFLSSLSWRGVQFKYGDHLAWPLVVSALLVIAKRLYMCSLIYVHSVFKSL
jgi:hypothetical protein